MDSWRCRISHALAEGVVNNRGDLQVREDDFHPSFIPFSERFDVPGAVMAEMFLNKRD